MMKFVERRPFADPDVAARVHGTQSAFNEAAN
jgi:hypothetical protein